MPYASPQCKSSLLIRIVFGLLILLTSMGLPHVGYSQQTDQENVESTKEQETNTDADDLKMFVRTYRESQKVYRDEYMPLQQSHQRTTSELYQEISQKRYLIQALKPNNGKVRTPESVRSEIISTQQRLDMLIKLEEVLTDMDEDAVEIAVKDAEDEIAELEQQRRDLAQPFSMEMSALMREHAVMNESYANAFKPYIKEKGTGDFSEYKRKFLNGNFAGAQLSMQYTAGSGRFTLSIMMADPNFNNPKVKLLDDKYVILSSSNRNIVIQVEQARVSVYSAGVPNKVGKPEEFLKSVIDLEKLAAGLRAAKPRSK